MLNKNTLYPIFLKVRQLDILIVGGGYVALEKLGFLLKSSPDARVTMIAVMYREETKNLATKHGISMIQAPYHEKYLDDRHIVVACTDDEAINIQVYNDCKSRRILVNVADHPDYCDFYMGSIINKGHVKVAISTNGKSPTTAKRLRQYFEDVIPDEIDDFVTHMDTYRKGIKGDFEEKLYKLNKHTEGLIKK